MSDEIKNNIPEEEDNIVELTDEDGTVTKFEYLTTVPYEGEEYVVLMVLDENGQAPEEEDGEVVILQIAQDDAGEDIYVSVDDDDVTQKVFDLFLEAMDARTKPPSGAPRLPRISPVCKAPGFFLSSSNRQGASQ